MATANALELQWVTSDPAPEFAPRLSPDGERLLFYVLDHTKHTGAAALSVASVNLGSSGRKLIAGPGAWFGAWYPDGRQVRGFYDLS